MTEDRRIISGDEFLSNIPPPEFAAEPILLKRQIVTLTGYSNHGKTTLGAMMTAGFIGGLTIGHIKFAQQDVLYLAGENQHNTAMQLKAGLLANGVPKELWPRLRVWPVGEKLEKCFLEIRDQVLAGKMGPFGCVMVDTSTIFFSGDDENNNNQMKEHVLLCAMFRSEIFGWPTVILMCHPAGKKPSRDMLQPRGGGAMGNVVDSMHEVWKDGEIIEYSHSKIRGPTFDTVSLATYSQPIGVFYPDGREVELPACRVLNEAEKDAAVAQRWTEDQAILRAIQADEAGTYLSWSEAAGVSRSGLGRALKRLEQAGHVRKDGGRWKVSRRSVQ